MDQNLKDLLAIIGLCALIGLFIGAGWLMAKDDFENSCQKREPILIGKTIHYCRESDK